jgi:hypothetical protein
MYDLYTDEIILKKGEQQLTIHPRPFLPSGRHVMDAKPLGAKK